MYSVLHILSTILLSISLASCTSSVNQSPAEDEKGVDWPVYLGDKSASHYSRLNQINKNNVKKLQVAWTFDTGDVWHKTFSQIQTNPLIIDGVLYGLSPRASPFALNAATGKVIWRFQSDELNAEAKEGLITQIMGVSRGLAYWTDGKEKRLFSAAGSKLRAIDATTGKLIPSFGREGLVDLREGLGRNVDDVYVGATSPGVIYKDILIQGTRLGEGPGSAPGHVRAYDVRTGKIAWTFRTIPYPGEYGYDTWPAEAYKYMGGANSWAGMSLDEERGIVFVPTGSAAFDFWGGNRHGKNLFANSLIALDAKTGKRIWHFQTVHHDIWDRDLPAPPNLMTVTHKGRKIDAVAQITKSGHVFLFHRETGEPLFPVEERPVPQSTMEGEATWPTQPFPVKPEPFARQSLTERDITDEVDEENNKLSDVFKTLTMNRQYDPLDTRGVLIYPGLDGGVTWGGAATTPGGILYVNSNEMPWLARLIKIEEETAENAPRTGAQVYTKHCAACHGADRSGGIQKAFPELLNVANSYSRKNVAELVRQGRGFMPGFKTLPEVQLSALIEFLWDRDDNILVANENAIISKSTAPEEIKEDLTSSLAHDVPYKFEAYRRFTDKNGNSSVKQPWGTLNAIDMNTGEYVWKVTLGHLPEFASDPKTPTGAENYGGPLVTAGGLVFIAATRDKMFRAFDKKTGKLLWQAQLPFGGYATPATYAVNGRQYVVIAAGGGKMGTESGDVYAVFALP